jgi:hypothetical protein
MADMQGRQTTGAMRAVTPEQYGRERNIVNPAPHYEPVADDYPSANPFRPNNTSVTDSFFDMDKNKSMFVPDQQNPGLAASMANPYAMAPPPGTQVQEEVVTTTTTTKKTAPQQPQQPMLAGLDPLQQPPQSSLNNKAFKNPYSQVTFDETTINQQRVHRV